MGLAGAAAAIGATASVAGAASSVLGSSKSSSGAQASQAIQEQQLQQNQANISPFVSAGQNQVGYLQQLIDAGVLNQPYDTSGQPTSSQVPQFNQQLPTWSQGSAPQLTTGSSPTFQGGSAPQFSWNPTQQGLESTPGYQFTLQQGLQGVQNSSAAQGLGASGSALAGAAQYATGLANQTYNQQLSNAESIYGNQLSGYNAGVNEYQASLQGYQEDLNAYNAQVAGYGQGTQAYNAQVGAYGQGVNAYSQQLSAFNQAQSAYQNQFNDYWSNQSNRYNQLYNLSSLGANASTGSGSYTTQGAANTGQAAQAGANYQSQGITGATNSLANYTNSAAFQNWLQSPSSGGGGGSNNAGYASYNVPGSNASYQSSYDPSQNFYTG